MSYGYKADYQLDKVKILENYNTIKTNEFNLEDIESLMDQLYLGDSSLHYTFKEIK